MNWRERMGLITKEPAPEELDWENAEVQAGHPVGSIRSTTLATYNLQVLISEAWENLEEAHVHHETDADKRVLADLPARLELIEEQLTDLLPEGYSARITEWNK